MQALCSSLDMQQRRQLHAAGAMVMHIGETAKKEALYAYTLGVPTLPSVSIVAGAHPDEPAGPLAALRLCQHYKHSALLQRVRLVVIPQLDIDGVIAQADWLAPYDGQLDPIRFAKHRLRRLPGEDREFAWPGAAWGGRILPECQAADTFFRSQGPVIAHLSLHGMAIAEGAWYLLDETGLRDACLWSDLKQIAVAHHFALHESFRYGEKGFRRSGRGFCTIPNGAAMRRWSLETAQPFARHFAFSSMEAACKRASGFSKPLCAVSEFPLIAVHKPIDAAWRDLFSALAFADEPQTAWQQYQERYDLRIVALENQVAAMVAMCEAVIAAALRR